MIHISAKYGIVSHLYHRNTNKTLVINHLSVTQNYEKSVCLQSGVRQAENRIAQRNPLGVGIFTEPYDYTFR